MLGIGWRKWGRSGKLERGKTMNSKTTERLFLLVRTTLLMNAEVAGISLPVDGGFLLRQGVATLRPRSIDPKKA
jgi:hypothetical protein